jgi:magnesium transporter
VIRVFRWDGAGCAVAESAAELPATAAAVPADASVWIDLENPTADEERRVLEEFLPVHPLTLADVTKPRRDPTEGAHLPKAEEFPDYLLVIANPLPPALTAPPASGAGDPRPSLGKLSRPQLSAILTHTVLVTHHYDPLPAVAQTREYVARHTECASRGPDYLFHLVLDAMVDEYAPVVERVGDRLEGLEGRLFRRHDPKVLTQLLHLKRRVSFLRKTLVLEREVLARLVRGEFALIDPREVAYYRNVQDHLTRYAELTDTAREMVADLLQTHLSATSNRLSETMKVLTVISTVLLPMNLLAGIYGMNFEVLPGKDAPAGFWLTLGAMAVLGVGALAYFRRRGWV